MTRHRLGPQLAGAFSTTYIAPELAKRVQAFARRVTLVKACELLGVGRETLEAARDGGRLRADTIARLLEALEREEAKLAQRRAG